MLRDRIAKFILERRKGWSVKQIQARFLCSAFVVQQVANELMAQRKVAVEHRGRARLYRGITNLQE